MEHPDRRASSRQLHYGSSSHIFYMLYVDLQVIGHEDSISWVKLTQGLSDWCTSIQQSPSGSSYQMFYTLYVDFRVQDTRILFLMKKLKFEDSDRHADGQRVIVGLTDHSFSQFVQVYIRGRGRVNHKQSILTYHVVYSTKFHDI